MTSKSTKIPLRVSNQRALVWDVEDIATLRSEHRICGLLGGTLPHLAQQNVFLGVPLHLMPEEVALLVEEELAVIVDDVHAHIPPSQEERVEWNLRQKLQQMRGTALKEGAKGDVAATKGMTVEAVQKRREREERRAAAAAKASSNDLAVEGDITAASPSVERASTPSGPSEAAYTVIIPTSSKPLSWYRMENNTYSTLLEARESGVWLYPSTAEERARCGVFRTLWKKGYYMGCGIKFGGEYLVYPGDPLRYHSHFVASVFTSSTSPLRPMEIVAHGRLGTATKKAHLLCTWDESTQEADVMSIEWAGFG